MLLLQNCSCDKYLFIFMGANTIFVYLSRPPPGDEGAWQLLLRHFSHCGNLLPNKINWQQHAIYGIYVKSEQTSAAIFVLHTKRPSWVAVNMVGKIGGKIGGCGWHILTRRFCAWHCAEKSINYTLKCYVSSRPLTSIPWNPTFVAL